MVFCFFAGGRVFFVNFLKGLIKSVEVRGQEIYEYGQKIGDATEIVTLGQVCQKEVFRISPQGLRD